MIQEISRFFVRRVFISRVELLTLIFPSTMNPVLLWCLFWLACLRVVSYVVQRVNSSTPSNTYSVTPALPENLGIPVMYDENGMPFVDAFLPDGMNPSQSIRGSLTSVSRDFAVGATHNQSSSQFFTFGSNSSDVFTIEFSTPRFYRHLKAFIGIRPGSELTRTAGSIAVIRNEDAGTAEMIIGATQEFFNSSCVPGSILTLNATSSTGRQVEVLMQNGTVRESFNVRRFVMDGFLGAKASVPWSLLNRIRESLRESGADGRHFWFTSCTQAAISSLPRITFTFAHGSLVYYPEDYVKFYEAEQSCKVQVDSYSETASLNPLLIPGTNVRVTRDNIWEICDSV